MKEDKIKTFFNRKNINSFLIALLFCTPMISFIVDINNTIPALVVGIIIIAIIVNRKEIRLKESGRGILIVSIFLIAFILFIFINILASGANDYVIERILDFVIFGVFSCGALKIMGINNENFDLKSIIKMVIFIYGVISIFLYQVNFWLYSVGERMAISYYMLPLFISFVLEFVLEKNKSIRKLIIRYILYIIIFFPYFSFLFRYMSRGTILSIGISILLYIIATRKSKKTKIIILVIMIIFILIFSVFALDILKIIQSSLENMNISISFIDKNIRLMENGNIGDGRDIIYENAIKGIKESPIIGNGIGSYKLTFNTYPHNLILQLWYEGGIIYMLLIMGIVIYSITRAIWSDKIDNKKKYLIIFIFSCCITRLMLSSEYWSDNFFWIYLYLSLELIQENMQKRIIKSEETNL